MLKQEAWKDKLSQISAKTLSIGGKQLARGRNEQKIRYSDPFQYTPLSGPKCIRLLRILPGVDTEVVSVRLFEANLDERPTYEALSYTWDLNTKYDIFNDFDEVKDKGHQRPILCNGSTLYITMNLYKALLEFRRLNLETPIWADQICINQQDNEEKIPQLAIMADIYTTAATVVIWLGELTRVKGWGLDFMEGLVDEPVIKPASRAVTDLLPQGTVLGKVNQKFQTAKRITSSLGKHTGWAATLVVLAANWFDRIWTVQEFLLAGHFRIMMGKREISQSTLLKAASRMIDFYSTDSLAVQCGLNNAATDDLRSAMENRTTLFEDRNRFLNGKRYTAEEYLIIARRKEATMTKDLVFAGAGLLEQGGLESVTYFSTTRDIYCAFATERLWPEVGTKALYLVGGTTPKVEGLPTWVPDLSTELIPEPLHHCGGQTFQSPIASSAEMFQIHGHAMLVKTAKWSEIRQVGESKWSWTNYEFNPYNSDGEVKDRMKTSTNSSHERFGTMFALLEGMDGTYAPTGERTMDALWNTLSGGASLVQGGDVAEWRDRFHHFFALTLATIRREVKAIRDSLFAPDPWTVPLVHDMARLEDCVSSFLDAFDLPIGGDPEPPLRKVISALSKRLNGAVNSEGGLANLRAAFREGDPAQLTRASEYGNFFVRIYDGRRIFVTDNGYLGISTEAAQAGDQIHLVAGADVPYVFRPVQHAEATFTLVGEAYVHGLAEEADLFGADDRMVDIQIV